MEVDEVITDSSEKLVLADLQRAPLVRRCVLEAIRLHSPGTVARKVTESFTLHGYTIPEGDTLMLSPYWCHRNPALFPEPELFQPNRWEKADLEKNLFLDGFVAFGGGRYQCPGRWFALMEIPLFVILLLSSYEIAVDSPTMLPKPSALHVVGTQLPLSSMPITYRRRHR